MDMPKSRHKGTSSFLVFSSSWWLALALECCMQLPTMWRFSMCGHWYRISLAEVVEMFQLNSGTSKFIWRKSSEHSFSCKTAAFLWLWWTSLVTSFVATKLRVKPYRILRWNSWIQRGQCLHHLCGVTLLDFYTKATPCHEFDLSDRPIWRFRWRSFLIPESFLKRCETLNLCRVRRASKAHGQLQRPGNFPCTMLEY